MNVSDDHIALAYSILNLLGRGGPAPTPIGLLLGFLWGAFHLENILEPSSYGNLGYIAAGCAGKTEAVGGASYLFPLPQVLQEKLSSHQAEVDTRVLQANAMIRRADMATVQDMLTIGTTVEQDEPEVVPLMYEHDTPVAP